ncbi:hypothetical protein J6590_070857 [Homalodisca vitripennis]|nr:hypothetical protein J6590_070857 [Homalodisca vitripennis]
MDVVVYIYRCSPAARSLVLAIMTLHRVPLVSGLGSDEPRSRLADPYNRNASREELGCHSGDVTDVAISLDHNQLKRYGEYGNEELGLKEGGFVFLGWVEGFGHTVQHRHWILQVLMTLGQKVLYLQYVGNAINPRSRVIANLSNVSLHLAVCDRVQP